MPRSAKQTLHYIEVLRRPKGEWEYHSVPHHTVPFGSEHEEDIPHLDQLMNKGVIRNYINKHEIEDVGPSNRGDRPPVSIAPHASFDDLLGHLQSTVPQHKAKGGRLTRKIVENLLDLAPKHSGPAYVGHAGPEGEEVHRIPALTPRIRSTVGALANKPGRGSWVIGKTPQDLDRGYQQMGGQAGIMLNPEFGTIPHRDEHSFLNHLAEVHGYTGLDHMATDLSTPPGGIVGGGAPMPGPVQKAKGGKIPHRRQHGHR